MKHALKVVAGLAVSALFLSFALRGFNFHLLRVAVSEMRYVYVFPAAAMFTTVMALRALRWNVVINSISAVPYRDVAPAVALGNLANSVLPARAGEVIRAATLSRKTGIPFASMAGTLVVDRVMDLVGLAAVMLVASALLPWDRIPIKTVAVTCAIGLIGMYAASTVLMRLRPGEGGGVKQKLLSFAAKIGDGFRAIRSPKRLAIIVGVSLFLWMLDTATIMVLSRATGLNLGFHEAAGVLVGIAFGVAIPAAPGAIGTYEFFGKEALTMMGHDPATALTFIVLLHFFQMSMIALMGIPSLFFISPSKK